MQTCYPQVCIWTDPLYNNKLAQIVIFATSIAYKMIKGFVYWMSWLAETESNLHLKKNMFFFSYYHIQRINLAESIIHRHWNQESFLTLAK